MIGGKHLLRESMLKAKTQTETGTELMAGSCSQTTGNKCICNGEGA